MQDKAFANPKISFEWNSEVRMSATPGQGAVTSLELQNRLTGERKTIDVDGVFVAIGHTPNTSLFTGKLEMDANGYIHTHGGTRTNIPESSPAATSRITSTDRPSPPPDPAAWRRSTPRRRGRRAQQLE